MDSLRSRNLPGLLDDVSLDIVARWPYIFCFAVVCLITKPVASHLWRSFQERKKGYGAIPRYPQLDPFLGLDVAFSMVASVRNHTMLLWLRNLHVKGKAKTISYNFFGTRFIHTTEPENMKALFATPVWKDFGVAPLRRNNRATMPFADKGVGTVDGHEWEISKSLIKPYFAREAVNNTQRLETHTDDLLSLVPKDGSTFDIQELLQRWVFLPKFSQCIYPFFLTEPHQFLDTSTHFMFGESIGCLVHPERAEVAWAMTDILRGLRFRLMMVRWLWLFRHKTWFDAIDVVHKYINRHIDMAYKDFAKRKMVADGANNGNGSTTATEETPERTDLLWTMIPHFGEDKERLRSELLVLFAPNNDTTSILISNVFWNLARRPDVYAKLREDVLSHGPDAPLTYERLRSMKYLDAVLNESMSFPYPTGFLYQKEKEKGKKNKDWKIIVLTPGQRTDYIPSTLRRHAHASKIAHFRWAVAGTEPRRFTSRRVTLCGPTKSPCFVTRSCGARTPTNTSQNAGLGCLHLGALCLLVVVPDAAPRRPWSRTRRATASRDLPAASRLLRTVMRTSPMYQSFGSAQFTGMGSRLPLCQPNFELERLLHRAKRT